MLKIENLTKTYANKVKALDIFLFEIESGDMFGFIGLMALVKLQH